MANADSVKAKIQGLIDTANTATGNDDTTLYDAVNTLIAGYGSGDDEKAQALLAMINGTDIPESGGTLTFVEGITRIPQYMYYMVAMPGVTVVCPNSLKSIGNSAFYGIGNDGSATFVFNDGLQSIGNSAFRYYKYGSIENFPSSLVSIGEHAFYQSYSATIQGDINLPNITTIAHSAFAYVGLGGSNVYIGKNISSIGENAFLFANSPAFTLTIDRAEDAISGAPWGATNATIVWTGDA